MMAGFRRANLRGSEELFRATDGGAEGVRRVGTQDELPGTEKVVAVPTPRPESAAAPPSLEGRLLRLTEDELSTLADAIQRVKFPLKQSGRPSVDEFERLEELRQKLLSVL